ncbi:MAG TPA: DUF4010 domain-containing protein, partial [Candidatus Binataceae bacterium]|nr:DUF4010 domain-containing protein [Candidatus Binataceae bacterium]
QLKTGNPLDFWFAFKFGMLLTIIMVASRAAQAWLGNRGLVSVAAISGLADVDAITLSATSMVSQGQAQLAVGTLAVMTAAAVNTLVKAVLMTFVTGLKSALRVSIPMLVAIAGGAVVAWMLR